ncbi:MAG: glycine cleavage system aminomethyltransferase GcvT, partial [Dehalococcoidia bacterium]|nr:glycine cleavage system aminomethyltransferase GcvT [Dehalococcoidia bacterium]
MVTSNNLRTGLYDTHVGLGGRIVPFGGWDMPVQYPNGILAEVKAV